MANPAGYNVANVQKSDGTWEINSTIDIKAATGGLLKVDGVDVTAGLEEIATIGGLTASATELNYSDGTVPGTAVASKTLALGTNKDVDVLAVADLKLGSGAGTSVTSTAAELNKLASGTTTAAEFNELTDVTSLVRSTISVGAEAANAIAVTLTLKDAANAAVNEARQVECWLSSSATTGALATASSGTVTASTGIILQAHTAKLIFSAVTSTAGVLVLDIAEAGPLTQYLWVKMPNGKPLVSAAITFV